jgi:hypothetical protein
MALASTQLTDSIVCRVAVVDEIVVSCERDRDLAERSPTLVDALGRSAVSA